MTCEPVADSGRPGNSGPIAYTGLPVGLLLTVAVSCLLAGAVLLLLARRRRRVLSVTLLVLLLGGAAMSINLGISAEARTPDCPPGHDSLTFTQTSVLEGLAPGVGPVAITGVVTNNSTDVVELMAIHVEITGVTTEPGSAAGGCDASDYLLVDSRMPVGRTLAPGGSITFAGASIGFSNKSTNQDTCKGATVHLLYTANPT
ncbi:hypothetical protein ACVBEQ_23105 [Nakamurella sp. GG22]